MENRVRETFWTSIQLSCWLEIRRNVLGSLYSQFSLGFPVDSWVESSIIDTSYLFSNFHYAECFLWATNSAINVFLTLRSKFCRLKCNSNNQISYTTGPLRSIKLSVSPEISCSFCNPRYEIQPDLSLILFQLNRTSPHHSPKQAINHSTNEIYETQTKNLNKRAVSMGKCTLFFLINLWLHLCFLIQDFHDSFGIKRLVSS
jgi:hypothetical protein